MNLNEVSPFKYAICRFCMKNLENFKNNCVNNCKELSGNHAKINLLSCVLKAISLKMEENELESCLICETCEREIISLITFLEMCLQTEQLLKQQIQKAEDDPEYVWDIEFDESKSDIESDNLPLSRVSKKLHQCHVCSKQFTSSSHLMNHSFKHTGSLPHGCEQCSLRFRSLTRLKRHLAEMHKKQVNEQDEVELQSECKLPDTYQCPTCSKTFTDLALFDQHQTEHTSSNQCKVCLEVFETGVLLNAHKKIHHRQHFCHCGRSFNRRLKLEEHVALVHEKIDIRRFECLECGKKFRSRYSLTHHGNLHMGLKPFLCTECPMAYHYPEGLHQHQRRMHSQKGDVQSKPFLCDNCGLAFSRKTHLQRHILRLHTANATRQFTCHLCPKAFLEAQGLRSHLRSHSNERAFKCNECGRSFRTQLYLQQHTNRVHLGLRPFPCSNCQLRFKLKAHLEKHMRTHTGEKPFSCPFCPYHCAEKSNLNKHVKIHCR